MQFFTRTTIIKPLMKIRRERSLPKSGEVVVGVGQDVMPNLVVARTPMETHFSIVDASEILRVHRDKVSDYMVVEMDSIVDIGTILAQRKQLFRTHQVLAPEEGMLFDIINGQVVIKQISEWLEKQAMVSGRVVSYVSDRGVVIETQGSLIQGVWGSGRESFGKLAMVSQSPDTILLPEHIGEEQNEVILVAGHIEQPGVLAAAEEYLVRGIIAGSMPAALCQAAPSLSFPIILTEGIGKQNMAPAIYALLQEADGQEASLFGSYDIELNQRPEIIIPQPASLGSNAISANRPVQVGQIVRILRAPYTGLTGTITNTYNLSQILATGAKAHGVDIQLDDGNIVFVPYANIDVLI